MVTEMELVNLWVYLSTWGLLSCCQVELEEAYLLFVPWVELATWPHQDAREAGKYREHRDIGEH